MADEVPATRLVVRPADQTPPQGPAAARSSFTQKLIEVTIKLQANQKTGQPITFAGTGSDTVTLSGFRTRVRVENSGGVTAHATVIINGLSLSLVNQLSTLGMIFDMAQKNTILISAGDTQNGVSPVFTGTIGQAFGHYNDLPNASLHLECYTGLIEGVVPVAASSFPQPTDVAQIMSGLALLANKGFENNGITAQLPPSYFSGTARDQIRAVARAAHINADFQPGSAGQEVLAIWPIGGSRTSLAGQGVPEVSKATGMILTPAFAANGFASVRTLFNPQIAFGGVIHVTSDVTPTATRDWTVQRMSLALDAYVPKGLWEQRLICYPKGFAAPPPQSAGGGR